MDQKELEAIKKKVEDQDSQLKSLADKNASLEKEKAALITSLPKADHVGMRYDSQEQKALSYFGCSSLKDLMEVNTESEKARAFVPREIRGLVRNIKSSFDTGRFLQQMFNGEPLDKNKPAHVKGILESNYGKNVIAPYMKAFGSTTPGEGDEWVPTNLSAQFIEEFELEKKVAAAHQELTMTSNPYELPVETDVPEAQIVAEDTAATQSNAGTSKIAFNATKFAQFTRLPEELNEDSAPDILSRSRFNVSEAQIRAREQALLNGDDTATHMDADINAGAATLAAKALKGHRRLALDASSTVDFAGAAITLAKCDEMLALMGKFGTNPRDLGWFCGPQGRVQLLKLDEVTTVEKFGPQATILSGALAALRGIPIVTSEYVREVLNASGVEDGATTDKAVLHLINIRRFWIGMRRPIRVRIMMDLPDQDRWLMSSYSRWDFKGLAQGASERSTVLGINIQV